MSPNRRLRLLALATAALAACSSQVEQPVEPVTTPPSGGQVQLPGSRSAEADAKVLADYHYFLAAQEAFKQNNPAPAAQFLANAQPSAMADSLRNLEALTEEALALSLAGLASDYPDLQIVRRAERGFPSDVLTRIAGSARLVVRGSHGRGAIARFLLGAISQEVLARLPTVTAIVR